MSDANNHSPKCRFCGNLLTHVFVDLGMSPLCESFLSAEKLNQMEPFYPLKVFVCENDFLVQLEQFVPPEEIFSEYAYFSSYADTWVEHARNYVDMIVERLNLDSSSMVVEIASNDGYLLQHFLPKKIPVLGIEPAANVAAAAIEKNVPTEVTFFGEQTAKQLVNGGMRADLIIGNNVLAQVPDLNGFVKGLKILLSPHGAVTMEFPHLARLVEGNQFDTIYHEHFSYFSLYSVSKIFAHHGLNIFDVEQLSTHGGSVRIYACHAEDAGREKSARLKELEERELAEGYREVATYSSFTEKVKKVKYDLLKLLIDLKAQRKTIAGYGAPGKGNTLLNYCGTRGEFIDFTVDRNPHKHGKYLPGTHIPIYHPDRIAAHKPDYILILPWNFKEEIMRQLEYTRSWGAKFIIPIPEVSIV